MSITKQEALEYHSRGRRGKIEVVPTKPCTTQRDLSLAYTPGVATPCLEIEKDPSLAFEYTAKGNLVAVVSNGTAVLGLGNIGALAGKPVMEGKGVLFKRFADIDTFDIELNTMDPERIIEACTLLEPTFGGINLEDIKAPECFHIEETLRERLDIPVFHDDQHGTAIISGAALLNALEIIGKRMEDVRIVVNGAGASGIACAAHYVNLGARKENIVLCDTKGAIYAGRKEGMNPYKERWVTTRDVRTLADAMKGADVFLGCSVKGALSQEMVKTMNDRPVIFALANPDPEITYEDAKAARDDVLVATGRSDYPNQVNNVLGFPFIFRGALDVRARSITENMKVAASHALADLAREDVPDEVARAYGGERIHFGPDYIIPKPFDHRVLIWEASAVAGQAMKDGVARSPVDLEEYKEKLEARLGRTRAVVRAMISKARSTKERLVYPEGEHPTIIRAAHMVVDQDIAQPILLGRREVIEAVAKTEEVPLDGIEIHEPARSSKLEEYVQAFYELRQRKGATPFNARRLMVRPQYYGPMMVRQGDGDALVNGITLSYPDALRPSLQVIGTRPGVRTIAGMFVILTRDRAYVFADTTVNIDPSAEDLAEIAYLVAEEARMFEMTPRVAMLSFSNFGSVRDPRTVKMAQAVKILAERHPDIVVDGEIQADAAVVPELLAQNFPFSRLKGGANVLIFPNLEAGNIAYKLVHRLGNAEALGPILVGMNRPVLIVQYPGFGASEVVNMSAVAAAEAARRQGARSSEAPARKEPVSIG
jgi:malate dehydrogenase (oxaloacetate-decarboxylating)(NADP+)